MSNFGFSRGLTHVESGGFNAATTKLTAITANAGYTELIASTDADADTVYVFINYDSVGTVDEHLISISVGAASSEQNVIENIPLSGRVQATSAQTADVLWFPIQVPSGSRIAAKIDADAANVIGVGVKLFKGCDKSFSFSGAKGYGVSGTTYAGTPVDPGGTANTKPASPTELVASTGETIRGFYVHVGINENATLGSSSTTFTDICIGGAGVEQVVVPDHLTYANTAESGDRSVFYDIEIPQGTRISAKSQCTDIDATDRVRTVALVGLI